MAISTTGSQVIYTGTNSANQNCPFPYLFFANTDLEVVTLNASNVSTTLVLGTDYSVTGANNVLGGSVTLFAAVPTTTRISIVRNNPETQLVSLTTGDRFPASVMERALDKLTMLCQELGRAVSKSLRVSDVSTSQPSLVPLPASVITTDTSSQLQFSSTSQATGTAPFFLAATTKGGQPTFQSLPAGSVGTTQIVSGSVGATQLADSSVTSSKLATGAVGATQLADLSVTSSKLATGSVGTTQLADSSVTSAKIATGSVGATQLSTGGVGTTQLADLSVTSAKIASGGVNTTQLADSSVTSAKIASGGVNTTQLADSSVTSAKIASGGVNTTQLADSSVTSAKIASGNVGTTQLADSSVGSTKLADGAVTETKLATGSVTPVKVGGNPTSGQFVLGTSNGVVSWQTPGSVSLQDNSVTSAKIVDGAVITSKLADNSISSQKIQLGAVGANQIATGAVGATQLGVGAVGTNQLGIGAVNSDNISTGAVGTTQLADSSITNAKVATTAGIAGSKIVPSFASQNISTTGNLSVGTTANTSRATIFDATSNPALLINQTGTGHAIRIEDDTNPDATPFVIDSLGNVGVGKTTPTQKLDVVGNGVFTGGVTALNTPKVACSWAGARITIGTNAVAGNTITATAGATNITWVSNAAWGTDQIGMVYYITRIANVAGATLGGRVVTNAGATDINAVGVRIMAISGTTATCALLAGAAITSQTITGNGATTGFTFATYGLRHSYGVSSIVRNAAADFTINFSTPFTITNYTWLTGGIVACSNIVSYGGTNIRLTFASESAWHQFVALGNI